MRNKKKGQPAGGKVLKKKIVFEKVVLPDFLAHPFHFAPDQPDFNGMINSLIDEDNSLYDPAMMTKKQ